MSTMNITPRRKDRTITEEQAEKILDTGEYGFLSLISDDEYPYGVPINYVKVGRAIYMHCAPEGRKIDCVKKKRKRFVLRRGERNCLPAPVLARLFERDCIR